MATKWTLTIDCAYPVKLAEFWALALGGAYLSDPDGVGPNLSFLKVPQPKAVKNRLHLDVSRGVRSPARHSGAGPGPRAVGPVGESGW